MTENNTTSATDRPVVCKSYRGPGLCADGFPITAMCSGRGSCHSCGSFIGRLPLCMRGDMSDVTFNAWFDDGGKPKLYRTPASPPASNED